MVRNDIEEVVSIFECSSADIRNGHQKNGSIGKVSVNVVMADYDAQAAFCGGVVRDFI